jgi:Glycosyl transferase family 11
MGGALRSDAIACHVQGGLGNQLFQLASLMAAAGRQGRPLYLDLRYFRHRESRPYMLRRLGFQVRELHPWFDPILPWPWSRLPARRRSLLMNIVLERAHGYSDQLESLPPRAWVSGYWQSPLYFADLRDHFRSVLAPSRFEFSGRGGGVLQALRRSELPAAVHVRRGDYITNPAANSWHGVCPLDYYCQAISYLTTRGHDTIFVFSDDPPWSRKHILHPRVRHIDPPTSARDYEDLILMSQCQGLAISNSSFSWWAAWLSNADDRSIIAPEKWFNKAPHSAVTLIPEGWVRL